jgi:hypothetical protein
MVGKRGADGKKLGENATAVKKVRKNTERLKTIRIATIMGRENDHPRTIDHSLRRMTTPKSEPPIPRE